MTEKSHFNIDEGMFDLFCAELQGGVQSLNNGIVALEKNEAGDDLIHEMMRAAHSLKGGARVLGIDSLVRLAHRLEDYFVALQKNKVIFSDNHTDILLSAVDVIDQIGKTEGIELADLIAKLEAQFDQLVGAIGELIEGKQVPQSTLSLPNTTEQPAEDLPNTSDEHSDSLPQKGEKSTNSYSTTNSGTSYAQPGRKNEDRVLRVTAQNLSRLMGLAGESMVESRWLAPFSATLLNLKKNMRRLSTQVDSLRELMKDLSVSEQMAKEFYKIHDTTNHCLNDFSNRINELDMFISRHSSLTDRLYSEVIESRMRPFSDGLTGFPRMVRDLAKQLHKKVDLQISGGSTPVDRDILDKLESPLNHLIRNAIDHGIETPKERERKGKNPEGVIKISAEHKGGILAITVSDDGRGIDLEEVRERVKVKELAKGELVTKLSQNELIDFLFLPGFSTQEVSTEISGRGMGLNIVQNMLQDVSGSVRVVIDEAGGISFHLHLPLTLSVIRALTVEIAGEPYAFPLARIERSLLVPLDQVQIIENRQYFNFEGQNIGLVSAAEVLEVSTEELNHQVFPVVVLKEGKNTYGLVVDNFMSERELVLQDLESRLGKIPNINAGAFMEDGSPALIIDVDDIISSIDNLLTGGRLHQLEFSQKLEVEHKQKRILVVDDSITVREVESRLLRSLGYEVETAVNGMDGWNAARMSPYDLIITDVDMPRMNGIELLKHIRAEASLKNVPVMIVSYKEREEDRVQGMEAGANFYMTKSSFHDDSLIDAVHQLIGDPL